MFVLTVLVAAFPRAAVYLWLLAFGAPFVLEVNSFEFEILKCLKFK